MFIQPAAPLPLHEASALVIEGNPQSRSILVAQLRELGLGNVVQCSRLHDARRKLEAARFDVVVCEQEFDRDSSSGQELLDDLLDLHTPVPGSVGDAVDEFFLGDGCHSVLVPELKSDRQQT